jgi:lysophospholipase L1-like esterase
VVKRALPTLTLLAATLGATSSGCRQHIDSTALMRAEVTGAPEAVHFIGRFDTSDPKGPRFAWPASEVLARFTGTAISVRLHDDGNNVFQVLLDGKPKGLVSTFRGRELYPIATDLSEGEHEVVLYKRTEARVGEVQFGGFVPAPEGRLVPVSLHHERKIELLGDSITAGYGDEGTSPTCSFRPSTENEYLTYGAITARNLGAEHMTLAWSGKTVFGMSELYERTLPARSDSPWDPHIWVPDVIVVNLGTNDFSHGDPGAATFMHAYTKLLEKLRAIHPQALIVCALGPMLSDTYPEGAGSLTHARQDIKQVVDTVRAHGDKRVVFLEFPTQDPATSGCDYHPNLTTHRQMADELTSVLKAQMGW